MTFKHIWSDFLSKKEKKIVIKNLLRIREFAHFQQKDIDQMILFIKCCFSLRQHHVYWRKLSAIKHNPVFIYIESTALGNYRILPPTWTITLSHARMYGRTCACICTYIRIYSFWNSVTLLSMCVYKYTYMFLLYHDRWWICRKYKTRIYFASINLYVYVHAFVLYLHGRYARIFQTFGCTLCSAVLPHSDAAYSFPKNQMHDALQHSYFFVLFIIHRYPSDVDMQKIVQCSLTPVLERFKNISNSNSNNNNYANVDQLAFAMINVYSEVSQFIYFVCFFSFTKCILVHVSDNVPLCLCVVIVFSIVFWKSLFDQYIKWCLLFLTR